MLATVAAAALVSCSKEQNTPEESLTPAMKTITITTDVQTKTTLDAGHEKIVWSSGDKISLFNNKDNTNTSLTYATGPMTVEVPAGTTEVYGHYPYYSGNEDGPDEVSIYISKNQTQKNPGQLAGNYYPMVAKGTVTGDNKANMVFYPVASALALNIYHTGLVGTEKVSKVVVTPTANTYFIGGQITDITGDGVKYTTTTTENGPITVTLTNALTLGSTKPANAQAFEGQIYVCLAKQSYASVQFVITTNKGVYTITSNSTPFDCVNNDFVPVNINLNKAAFVADAYPDEPTSGDCWYRVEKPDWLVAGDRVVIVNHDGTQALGNVQKSNNRDGVSVAVSDDGDYKKITTTNDNMQVFIVEDGTADGSFAFWCENGADPSKYMYAASSSSNHLKFQVAKDGNASFVPTLSHGLGYLTAQGSNTNNVLRYNNYSGSNLFSCYSGTSNNDISIYKYYGTWTGSTTCADPTISQDVNTITIACTTPGVKIYYTTNGDDPTAESTLYTAPFNITEPVTVKAIATRSHYTTSGIASKVCPVKVATPIISSSANAFSISCATEGVTIYYETSTTDLASVATPTTSSNVYSAAVDYDETTYVKAIAVRDGYTDSDVASATCAYSSGGPTEHVATINFGSASGSTKIQGSSSSGTGPVTYTDTGNDSEGNTWTITTVSSNDKSFTQQSTYSQVGASSKPVTSITFTTTLSDSATNISLRAKFGGFSSTAGSIALKVGDSTIGSGSLNGSNDVTVTSSSTGSGTVLTVTVTGIARGVKCYWLEATYTN